MGDAANEARNKLESLCFLNLMSSTAERSLKVKKHVSFRSEYFISEVTPVDGGTFPPNNNMFQDSLHALVFLEISFFPHELCKLSSVKSNYPTDPLSDLKETVELWWA